MNFLFVDKEFPPNKHGGIGSYNYIVANLLSKLGHDVTVLTSGPQPSVVSKKESFGLLYRFPYKPNDSLIMKYISFVEPLLFAYKVKPYFLKLIQEKNFDLVEFPSSGGYGFLSAKSLKETRIVTRFHGSLGKAPLDDNAKYAYDQEYLRVKGKQHIIGQCAALIRRPIWWMEQELIQNSDIVTFPSVFAKSWLTKKTSRNFMEFPVIPNGVDVDNLQKESNGYSYNNAGKKVIFFIGRCSLSKGASVFVRALPNILKKDSLVEVVFAGPLTDPIIEAQLVHLKSQFPERVQFPGRIPRNELLKQLSSSYMLVHPTFYEISPMAVIEAMTLGVPSVASNTGPMQETIKNRETGFLFNTGDSVSLENRVLEMLSLNKANYLQMREACMQQAKSNFNLQTIIQDLLSVYSSLIGKDL